MLRLVLIALFAAGVVPAKAETWPSRPLTMVVPFATGGPMDAVARILQSALSDALHEQVIVENVGGAGGIPAPSCCPSSGRPSPSQPTPATSRPS